MRSKIQQFREHKETLEHVRAGLLRMKPNTKVLGSGHSSPTKVPSPGAWSAASSPSDLGGTFNPPLPQHPEHSQDPDGCKNHQPPTELLHRTKVQLDF
jgi:hypothetical protein